MDNNSGIDQNKYQSTPCHEVDYDRALPIVLGQIFIYGDLFTKLSFLVMGLSNIVRGQLIKGYIFLATEAIFIYFMCVKGITCIKHLDHLGNVPATQEEGAWGRVVLHDDSRKFLLYGVGTILICLAFLVLWAESVKAGYETQSIVSKGKRPNSFYRDVLVYFDKKLYRTLLFLPIMGVLLFTILPIVFMICIAFTNYDQHHNGTTQLFTWSGWANFKALFGLGNGADNLAPTFWSVLGWTIVWAICTTFLCYMLGMILAIIINRKGLKFKKLWRTIFIMSIAVPQFVSLLIMKTFLEPLGLINQLLDMTGIRDISNAYNWLGFPTSARIWVIVINLWVGIPYTMLITTGVLMNIPAELYEAAKVDGANTKTMFFKITLPYMIFVTTPYLITQFIGNINNFSVIYLLTNGAPSEMMYGGAGKTDLLVTWLYKLTMDKQDYGICSVIGIFIFVICSTLSLITYRSSGAYKNEEEFQ